MGIVLSDPTYGPREEPTRGERLAERFIRDRRDAPFLGLMARLTVTVVPTGVVLFLPGPFRWWIAAAHFALVVYFMGPFILMLHNTSHRTLFKRPWGWMNKYIPWVLGPFFGESPETYFAHHVGMHHAENNLEDDLSTTLPYRRDSLPHFLAYFFLFFFGALVQLLTYFAKKRRYSLLLRCALGETLFYVAVGGLFFVNWRATLIVFVIPFLITRFAMMAGNWGQHAFVDEAAPANNYRNSITCINSSYNRRCFNDGYHIGHHLKSTRHWTEMPGEFERNIRTYEAEGAIVFAGIDFFVVWFFLMLKRYDWLAARMVPLGDAQPSVEESIAVLRSRTQWTRG
jgi:fatty acid desaturase